MAASIGNPWLTAQADHHLARLARHRGDMRRAEDLHHQALAQRVEGACSPAGPSPWRSSPLWPPPTTAVKEAARLWGASAALRRSIGLVRWPVAEDTHAGELARLRATVGRTDLEASWPEGEALTVDDAVGYAARARGERKRPPAGWPRLTPKEVAVAKLVAEGLTNPQIGQRLFIRRGTVKTHLAHIFAKLGVTTRAERAAAAVRHGL